MTPRRARLWHAPQLTGILWHFARQADWLPQVRSRRTDLHVMSAVIRRGWVRILRDRRGPAAFIARDGARIHALYVHPRARRNGLGRTLLAEAKGQSAWLELWVAEANTPARRFYRDEGFVEARRGIGQGNDENLPDIQMVWSRPEEVRR